MSATRLCLPFLFAAVCFAQETVPAPPKAVRMLPPVVTMTFAGGTMAQFVAAVRAVEPKANIVLQPAAAEVRVPALAVSGSGLDQLLESVCDAADSAGLLGCSEQRGSGESVFAILMRKTGPQPGQPEQMTAVLSLNTLTAGYPHAGIAGLAVETVLSAIEAGTGLGEGTPTMRYHTDSGLLFLRGSPAQLRLANEVLQILESDQMNRLRNAQMTGPKQPAAKNGAAPADAKGDGGKGR